MNKDSLIQSIIQKKPLIFPENAPVSEAISALQKDSGSCALVVNQQKLIGILTERDVVRAASCQVSLDDIKIADLMTPDVITLEVSEVKNILQITQLFKQHHIRHLPILDAQEKVIGLITPTSIRQQLKPEYFLRYVRISEVMVRKVITSTPDSSLLSITQRLMLHKVSCVVVVESESTVPLGIITERDIVQYSSLGLDFNQVTAQTAMSTPLSTLQVQDSLWKANQLMKQLRIRRLVITEANGNLAGIVTQSQVLRMCDPQEMHYVMRTMQRVIVQRTQAAQKLSQQLKAKNIELQRLANLDSLTEIANRHRFNTYMEHEWRRLQRHQRPLSLILGDIDGFKGFNDTYGHFEGDKCLKQIAKMLQQLVQRPQDLVARIGGEEFVVVLPETDLSGAEHMAREILTRLRQLQIPHSKSTHGQHVSMSLGLATVIPSNTSSIEQLLTTADRRLYRAKQQGGNTYSLSDPAT